MGGDGEGERVGPARPITSARRTAAGRLTVRGEALVAVAVLGAMTALFFNPLLRGSTFSVVPARQTTVYPWRATPSQLVDDKPQTDQADLNHPWQVFISATLRSGAFPFWNPHAFGGGYPFFTNGQSAVVYPPRLLTALTLPPGWAHDVFSVLHVLLSGVVMYLLLKEFGVGMAGALLAAVAWMFSTFNLAWLHFEVVAPVSVFLPLSLLCVRRAVRTSSWGATTVAGLVLGLALVSGHLLILWVVYLVAVAYAAALAARRVFTTPALSDRRRAGYELARLGILLAVSAGAAAAVLVPTALGLAGSNRTPFTYSDLETGAFHGTGGDIPYLAPAKTLQYLFFPPPLPILANRLYEMAFVGTATVALALIGLFVRAAGAWLARTVLVVASTAAIGTPVTWVVYNLVPGFDVYRPYSRLLQFSGFAVALLAGLGLDAVWRWASPAVGVRAPDEGTTLGRRPLARALLVVLSGVAVMATAWQLGRYGRDVNQRFVPRNDASMFPATPLIEAVRAEVEHPGRWPGRILPLVGVEPDGRQRAMLYMNEALVFGIDSTSGYDSVVPSRIVALMRVLQGEKPESVVRLALPWAYDATFLPGTTRFDLLDRLGVTTIVATPRSLGSQGPDPWAGKLATTSVYDGPDGRVLRVLGARAGPFLVHGQEIVADGDQALRRFVDPSFDSRRSVVLERAELTRTGQGGLQGRIGEGRVLSANRGVNTARMVVESTSPAWLVVPDSWAEGWTATVDGRPTPVLRANYAKRAVRVPAGRSVVQMRYLPAGFRTGLGVTAATLLACVGGLALVAVRRLRRRDQLEEELVGEQLRVEPDQGPIHSGQGRA